MIRAFKAQLLTMRNRSTVLGLAIPCVGLPVGILVMFLVKNSLRNDTTWTDTGVLTELLVGGSFVFSVAAIVMAARAVGTKFDYGTMQVALTHQPNRVRLLTGTVAAAISGVLIALALAEVAMITVGWTVGSIVNIDTSAFLTADSLRAYSADVLRIGAGIVGFGILAATVATLTRSSATAIAGTLAWALVIESLALLVWSSAPKFLPATVLLGLMNPAEAAVSLGSSMLRGGLWVAAAGALGLLVFQRREVSG